MDIFLDKLKIKLKGPFGNHLIQQTCYVVFGSKMASSSVHLKINAWGILGWYFNPRTNQAELAYDVQEFRVNNVPWHKVVALRTMSKYPTFLSGQNVLLELR